MKVGSIFSIIVTIFLSLIFIIVLYFYTINAPSINKSYFISHKDEYLEFINEFIASEKGCIDIDRIIDNNANYLVRDKGIPLREICNQGEWTTKLSSLYQKLHIAEVSTLKDYIKLSIKTNKGTISNLSFIYYKNDSSHLFVKDSIYILLIAGMSSGSILLVCCCGVFFS